MPGFVLLALPSLAADFDAAAFYATTCATCHGPAGAGDGAAAAAFTPRPASFATAEFWSTRTDDLVAKAIREGGPAIGKSPLMAPLGAGLDEAQMKALVGYLKSLAPKK